MQLHIIKHRSPRLGLIPALLLHQTRDIAFSMWSLLLPIAAFLIVVFFTGDGTREKAGSILAGVSIFVIITNGLINGPLAFKLMEDSGALKRLNLAPIRPAYPAIAATFAQYITTLISLASLTVLGAIVAPGHIPSAGLVGWMAFAAAAGGLPGLILTRTRFDLLVIKNIANVAMILAFALSGTFFTLPAGWLNVFHWINPYWWLHQGLLDLAAHNSLDLSISILPLAIGLLSIVIVAFVPKRRASPLRKGGRS